MHTGTFPDGRVIQCVATDCSPSLSTSKVRQGHLKKLPETSVLAVLFDGYPGFPHHLQLAIHDVAYLWKDIRCPLICISKNDLDLRKP